MQRREFIKSSLACGGLVALSTTGLGCKRSSNQLQHLPSHQRPNILWISCEDISPRLGCYEDKIARTPNIDQLASEGMRYTNVYTTSPVCSPCRSGIITSMYQTSIGTHHMRTTHKGRTEGLPTPYLAVPPPYVKAFPEYLRAAGYYCINNSKTDYQFSFSRETPVTIWDECNRRAHYRNRPDKNQPFFAVFNYTLTHESRTWLEPEHTDPNTVHVPPYYPDTPAVRKTIARVYDNIADLDKIVGKLLRELEDDGLAENTIVFFWSDHGDGLPRAKRWPYDSGTHIPLIIRWPGNIQAGSVDNDLISSIDFGPTVLSLAGVPIPTHMQGQAFLGPQAKPPREYVFSARDRFDESYDMIRSVRDKRYRYLRNYYPNQPYVLWVPYRNKSPIMQEMQRLYAEGKLEGPQKIWFTSPRPPEELYNCSADPHQIYNLVNDPKYRKVLERLRRILDKWREETSDMGDIPESEMVNKMWPDGVQPVTARPWFIPNAPSNRGLNPIMDENVIFNGPVTIDIYCAIQGASIAYTTESGDNPHWLLYTGPIRLTKGLTTIRAKAVRYGYKESSEIKATFTVNR